MDVGSNHPTSFQPAEPAIPQSGVRLQGGNVTLETDTHTLPPEGGRSQPSDSSAGAGAQAPLATYPLRALVSYLLETS